MEPIEQWQRRLADIDASEARERRREWQRRIAVALGLPVDGPIERSHLGLPPGASTAPLTDDQISTLVELVRTDRRDDYDFLCSALGVTNGPELWTRVKLRGAPPGR